ncbi:MAG: hypothetical protein HXY18_01790 [Bryobacteraceae bacterium]|nr:hypothetical protein [Bryobacteraceae bacterium]
MRNYMAGMRLADALKMQFHPMVVKAERSPHDSETVEEVARFNSILKAAPEFALASWADLRYASGQDLLSAYGQELP